ncbi:DUF1516 family protein [Neobacillus sp. PS3-40]|uniref:DUF1516 family protein n=1 Tax=Neobacillus sp. PS3-40 TaxID=3070679 RepID=UPI0027DEC09C|nr:DUF1516 family protein [Neobacillus sp. PS3-40]WML43338.1 DUF1516 family protein [Neobacillus sp. PS3-40]
MTDSHVSTWILTLVLFGVALILNKKGNAKGFKIIHMILRVFYLLTIVTGVMLLYILSPMYIVKIVVGLWIISLIELILIRTAKNKKTSVLWYQFGFAFLLVLYLGLKLPLGFHPFS